MSADDALTQERTGPGGAEEIAELRRENQRLSGENAALRRQLERQRGRGRGLPAPDARCIPCSPERALDVEELLQEDAGSEKEQRLSRLVREIKQLESEISELERTAPIPYATIDNKELARRCRHDLDTMMKKMARREKAFELALLRAASTRRGTPS